MSSMLVVGSVALDTLHLPSGSFEQVLGGSAVFGALAGALFCPVQMVGVVGHDFPAGAVRLLEGRGVDLAGLEKADGKTFHWEGRYAPDLTSRETLNTELNAFATFRPKIPPSFRRTPFVMLGNIDPVLQVEVLAQVERPKLVVADTMNFWITGKPDELRAMLKRIDVLILNEEEGRLLAGVHNTVKVARELHAMGPRIVVVKQGEYGALLFEGDDVFSAPAYPISEVVDPTGAGDTFAGGFLGYLAQVGEISKNALRRAVVFGSALASCCVEGVGTECLARSTMDEAHDRFERFRRLAHFATEEEVRALRRAG